jgi:hypothetical protein
MNASAVFAFMSSKKGWKTFGSSAPNTQKAIARHPEKVTITPAVTEKYLKRMTLERLFSVETTVIKVH